MDNRKVVWKGNGSNRVLLLTVLIGFCVLAIIEIIYGQRQIRIEKERLALEEQNKQTVQEMKNEWNELKGSASVTTDEIENDTNVSAGNDNNIVPDKTVENLSASSNSESSNASEVDTGNANAVNGNSGGHQHSMQIVLLGDSILEYDEDGKGVADLLEFKCDAKVYNLAIGGTTAAVLPGENYGFENWESTGLLGVVNAILGNISTDVFDGYRTKEVLEQCDFEKTDYFIVEYGINDFLTGKIPQSIYLPDGGTLNTNRISTYSGALEAGVTALMGRFPNAKVVLVSPHKCNFFAGKTFIGDAYSLNLGYGALVEFSYCTNYVYEQRVGENILYFNAFEDSGIDAETADEYLEDGVHLSPQGCEVYAEHLARIINADFRPVE